MGNNRKIINELNKKVHHLENRNFLLSLDNKDLLKKIERQELQICELNTKLCRSQGKLDKIKNMYRLMTGDELE